MRLSRTMEACGEPAAPSAPEFSSDRERREGAAGDFRKHRRGDDSDEHEPPAQGEAGTAGLRPAEATIATRTRRQLRARARPRGFGKTTAADMGFAIVAIPQYGERRAIPEGPWDGPRHRAPGRRWDATSCGTGPSGLSVSSPARGRQ